MENYTEHIISSLTANDMKILAVLETLEANATFKSVTRHMLRERSELTDFKFRKALNRLEALKFIAVSKEGKAHRVYVTEFGEEALNKNLEEDE
jgi:RIO-like serine/threonine protein kinase